MNPDSYTHTELAEILTDLNLIDEGDEQDLSLSDLEAILSEYNSEAAAASYYSY